MTIELNPITSGYSTGLINDNFQAIEDYVNDNLLQRDGVETGEVNQMEVDLDMNSNFVFNLPEPTLEHQAARLQDVQNAVAGGAANLITFTPYGTITSENVQGAIQDLSDQIDDFTLVTTTTGVDQPLEEALDDRVNRGAVGNETVTTETSARSITDRFSDYVTPEDFGAVGDGVADDSDAVESALGSGKPVLLLGDGTTYRTTRELSLTLTAPLFVYSLGSTIAVDSAASIRRAVYVDMAGHYVHMEGVLHTDCQQTSYTAWHFDNLLEANKTSLTLDGYRASNCYRAGTDFPGGDGLRIVGSFRKVSLNNIEIRNVIAATGAIVQQVQGITGITVTRNDAQGTDAELVSLTNFHIENVYSEDPTETFDQDGAKLFSAFNAHATLPTESIIYVSHGKFKNCSGRAMKLQGEWASLSDIQILRTGFPYAQFVGNNEIDMQKGAGHISDINAFYNNAYTDTFIQCNFTSSTDKLNNKGLTVRDINITQIGTGAGFQEVIAALVNEPDVTANITASGINHEGSKIPFCVVRLFSNSSAQPANFFVHLDSVTSAVSEAFVHRVGDTPTWATGVSLRQKGGASKPFFTTTTAGNSTISLIGANKLVT